MYKIMAFIITNMIATTMVFAQHTRSSATSDINQVIESYSKISEVQKNKGMQCTQRTVKKLVRKIDQRIAFAQNTNETLDQSITKELKRFELVKDRQVRMTKRILKRRWRIKHAYKKMRRNHPSMTRSDFVKGLKNSISEEKLQEQESQLVSAISISGSMENYLLDMKEKVMNCDETFFQGDTMGIVLLILFIGLPVLSILSALFALIFGAYWWALGLFAFAVVMLLALFIWSNVERVSPKKETDPDLELDLV